MPENSAVNENTFNSSTENGASIELDHVAANNNISNGTAVSGNQGATSDPPTEAVTAVSDTPSHPPTENDVSDHLALCTASENVTTSTEKDKLDSLTTTSNPSTGNGVLDSVETDSKIGNDVSDHLATASEIVITSTENDKLDSLTTTSNPPTGNNVLDNVATASKTVTTFTEKDKLDSLTTTSNPPTGNDVSDSVATDSKIGIDTSVTQIAASTEKDKLDSLATTSNPLTGNVASYNLVINKNTFNIPTGNDKLDNDATTKAPSRGIGKTDNKAENTGTNTVSSNTLGKINTHVLLCSKI